MQSRDDETPVSFVSRIRRGRIVATVNRTPRCESTKCRGVQPGELHCILHRRGVTTRSSRYYSIMAQTRITWLDTMHSCGVTTTPSSYFSTMARLRVTQTNWAGLSYCTSCIAAGSHTQECDVEGESNHIFDSRDE